MSTENKNIISDQNFQEITDLTGLLPGQRIIRVGDRMLPVGFMGGNHADLSFVTAEAGDILEGKVGADVNGDPVTGTLVAGGGGSEIDLSFITAEAGDILEGKVGADVNGNPVTGTLVAGEGGSSNLSFALITAYSPYVPAYSKVTAIEVSGFGTYNDTDYSIANGTYAVTADTDAESDPINRVYQNGEYFFYFYSDMGDPMYGRWYIGKTIGASYENVLAYVDEMSQTPPSGTKNWYENISWNSIQITTTLTEVDVPAVAEVLTAVEATDYDAETGLWTTGETADISGYEKTPATDDVFAVKDATLIGSAFSNKYLLATPDEPNSDEDGSWICEASSLSDGTHAFDAFTDGGESWHSESGSPQWLTWCNQNYKYCIKNYMLRHCADSNPKRQSVNWYIQGSDNGVDWTDIDHAELESAEPGSVYYGEITGNNQYFRIHRFYSAADNGSIGIGVEYFCARGYRQPDDTAAASLT